MEPLVERIDRVYTAWANAILCVLIQEQHELGIEPIFWKEETAALPLLSHTV